MEQMDRYFDLDELISQIRKRISSLEWDLKIVKDEDTKIVKERTLEKFRAEFERLKMQKDTSMKSI